MALEASAAGAAKWPASARVVLGLAFLASVGNYAVLPFLAIYLHVVLHLPLGWVGFLVGLPFLTATLFGPLTGWVTDRVDLSWAYAGQAALYGASAVGLALARTGGAALVWLALAGITIPVSQGGLRTLLGEALPPLARGRGQHYLYWSSNVGVVVGLVVASRWLKAGASPLPFWLLAGVSGALGLIVASGLAGRRPPAAAAEHGAAAGIGAALSDASLVYALLATLCVVFMQAQLSATVPLDIAARIPHGREWFGPLLALNGAVVVVSQFGVLPLLRRLPPAAVFLAGAVGMALGFGIGALGQSLGAWALGIVVLSGGESLWAATLNDFLGLCAPRAQAGVYFATSLAAQAFGFFIGALAGSELYRAFGPAFLATLLIWALAAALFFGRALIRLRRRDLARLAQRLVLVRKEETTQPTADAPLVVRGATVMLAASSFPDPGRYGIPAPPEPLVWLADVDEEARAWLFAHMPARSFRPGDIIVRQGETARAVLVVTAGELEVLAGDNKGRRLTTVPTGSIIGEQAFFDGRPRSATVRALTSGEVRQLTWADVERLAAEQPDLALFAVTDLARVLSYRLRLTTQALAAL
jgi:CRP/FNR family cyclic AMP-dependent transcriptional regulator